MRWVRRHWGEEDIWFYFELNAEGWVTRQVELQGPNRVPIAAASLSEWFRELDAGGIQQYQARFGGVADKPITVDQLEDYEAIPVAAFEQLWREARTSLEI